MPRILSDELHLFPTDDKDDMANPSLEVRRSFPQIDLNYIRSNRRAFSQSSDTYAAQYLIKGRGPQVDLDLRPNLSLKNSPHLLHRPKAASEETSH